MDAIGFIMIFQSANSIMTKGVLRGGGDTKMLMLADNIFLWLLSIPLGLLAGFVFGFPAFWIYTCLKADQIRLRGHVIGMNDRAADQPDHQSGKKSQTQAQPQKSISLAQCFLPFSLLDLYLLKSGSDCQDGMVRIPA